MRWTLLAAAALMILPWLGPIVWRWITRKRHRKIGFAEYIRNPLLAAKLGGALAKRRSDEDRLVRLPPAQLVEMLLDDEGFDVVVDALEDQGGRAAPALVAAISDPRYRRKTPPEVYERMHVLAKRKEPLETVLECLGEHALREHAHVLEPLLTDASADIRKPAAYAYAAIGSDEVIDGTARAMADEDTYVVGAAMRGVIAATELGVATRAFRARMFDIVLSSFLPHDGRNADTIVNALLALDPNRCKAWLFNEALPKAGSGAASSMLEAMRRRAEVVDEPVLIGLWERFAADSESRSSGWTLVKIVRALAEHDSEEATRITRLAMASPIGEVRAAAAEAMAHRMGITDPYGRASAAYEARGWEGMTAPQRHVVSVRHLIDQVLNGGYEQYFVNSHGNDWPEALAGLKAMGAQREHASFETVIARFGANGPSRDRDQRHEQLAALVRADAKPFEGITDNVFETHDDIEVLLMRYIVAHRADFT